MLTIAFAMLVILLLAGGVVVYVAYPARGQKTPYVPWVGEAMGSTDYQDLDETPDTTAGTTATLAAHLVHVARLLRDAQYPAGS